MNNKLLIGLGLFFILFLGSFTFLAVYISKPTKYSTTKSDHIKITLDKPMDDTNINYFDDDSIQSFQPEDNAIKNTSDIFSNKNGSNFTKNHTKTDSTDKKNITDLEKIKVFLKFKSETKAPFNIYKQPSSPSYYKLDEYNLCYNEETFFNLEFFITKYISENKSKHSVSQKNNLDLYTAEMKNISGLKILYDDNLLFLLVSSELKTENTKNLIQKIKIMLPKIKMCQKEPDFMHKIRLFCFINNYLISFLKNKENKRSYEDSLYFATKLIYYSDFYLEDVKLKFLLFFNSENELVSYNYYVTKQKQNSTFEKMRSDLRLSVSSNSEYFNEKNFDKEELKPSNYMCRLNPLLN